MYSQFIIKRTAVTRCLFRTESDGSVSKFFDGKVNRAVFFAEKQKAIESREFRKVIEESYGELNILQENRECYHPYNLCMKCPRCSLFGAATVATRDRNTLNNNIRSRILYSDSFSDQDYESCVVPEIHIGVDDMLASNGRSMRRSNAILPLTTFVSIITLVDASIEELSLFNYIVSRNLRYGTIKSQMGLIKNSVLGVFNNRYEKYTTFDFVGLSDSEIMAKIETNSIVIPKFETEMALQLKEKSEKSFNELMNRK